MGRRRRRRRIRCSRTGCARATAHARGRVRRSAAAVAAGWRDRLRHIRHNECMAAPVGGGSSAAVTASRQLVVLISGTSRLGRVKPIIGPPMSRRSRRAGLSPANSSSSRTGVPISASTFIGRARASPVSVVIREISGLPSSTASWMATQVPTFWQSMPMSAGRPPLGTSSPVRIWISCFSPPDGYLVGNTLIVNGRLPTAARTAAMASGLLSSMPMRIASGSTR
ncbi:hypothetical protein SSTU70S_06422 [Stutzerimonas stutzeri]